MAWYIGLNTDFYPLVIFSEGIPTKVNYPRIVRMIGPFNTEAQARSMASPWWKKIMFEENSGRQRVPLVEQNPIRRVHSPSWKYWTVKGGFGPHGEKWAIVKVTKGSIRSRLTMLYESEQEARYELELFKLSTGAPSYQENPIERSQHWQETHRKWTPEEKREHKKFLRSREPKRMGGPTWQSRPVQEYAEGMYDPYAQNPLSEQEIVCQIESEMKNALHPIDMFRSYPGRVSGKKRATIEHRFADEHRDTAKALLYTLTSEEQERFKESHPSTYRLMITKSSQWDEETYKIAHDELNYFGSRAASSYDEYEQNPSVKVPKGVPEAELNVAEEVYQKFHDFAPTKIEEVKIPTPKVLVKIGEFTAQGYFSDKWKFQKKLKQRHRKQKGQHYIHEFKDEQPSMVAFAPESGNPEYGTLIAWRRCRLTKHGIEDIPKGK